MSNVKGARLEFTISLGEFLVLVRSLSNLSLARYFVYQINIAYDEFLDEEDLDIYQDKTATITVVAHKDPCVSLLTATISAGKDLAVGTEVVIVHEKLTEFNFEDLKTFFSKFSKANCIEYKRIELLQ